MKKLVSLFLVLIGVFSLAGCKEEKPEEVTKEDIKIILPSGAPLMTQLGVYDRSQAADFKIAGHKVIVTVVGGPDPLKAAYGSGEYDVIVSPINMGATMFKAKHMYKYAANVSDGNICLASTTKIESFEDLNGMNLVAFGDGQINSLALTEVIKADNLNLANTSYLASVKDTNAQLIADKNPNTVYLVAEPAISGARAKLSQAGKKVYTLDLLKEFKEKIGVPFMQAGVFVKDGTPKDFVDAYLEMVKNDINDFNTDPTKLSAISTKYPDLGLPAVKVLEKSVKGCNLAFRLGKDCKADLEKLASLNLKYFGGEVPSEEFYL